MFFYVILFTKRKVIFLGTTTEAQKKAIKKYLSSRCEFKVRVSPEEGERIKAHAESLGKSVNSYIFGLISQDMGDLLTVPGEAREPENGE